MTGGASKAEDKQQQKHGSSPNKNARASKQAAGAVCEVCTSNPSKYKCPACSLRYCSLACFKQHKEQCNPAPKTNSIDDSSAQDNSNEKNSNSNNDNNNNNNDGIQQSTASNINVDNKSTNNDNNNNKVSEPIETKSEPGVLSSQLLKKLVETPEILQLLTSDLKQLVRNVDGSNDREAAFDEAMHNPAFEALTTRMLDVIESNNE